MDFREFLKSLSVTSRGTVEERLNFAFKLYDQDGDGMISKADMLQVTSAMYQMTSTMIQLPSDEDTPQKRVDKIFAAMDIDKDDKLSVEEFQQGAKSDPSLLQALSVYDGVL